MSNQMTPREHNDMRDLLLASTQRIRPTGARRALIAASLALILVGGVVGAIAATALNASSQVASSPTGEPTTTVACTPSATPSATPLADGPYNVTRQPSVPLPEAGGHVTLQPDPGLTGSNLLGALEWAIDRGLDVTTLQGFRRAGTFEPWTAKTSDGCGSCILIGTGGGGLVWDQLACEYNGVPPSVERPVDGSVLRFTVDGEVSDVYAKEP